MKEVNFKSLSIKNFLSVGEEPIVINFEPGLHVITGVNKDKEDRRNGVGKSTIADALYFAVFGTTIRELKKEFIANSFTTGACEVVLDFEVTVNQSTTPYKIVRMLNPSRLDVFKGEEDITKDSIGNTNTVISNLINASPEIFKNCVILTINDTTSFMAKKKGEKRKFIEGIFNLEIFSKMLTKLNSEYKETRTRLAIENVRFEATQKSYDQFDKAKEDDRVDREDRKDVLLERRQNNTREISTLKLTKSKVTKDDLTAIETVITELATKNEEHSDNIRKLEQHLSAGRAVVSHKQDQLKQLGTDEPVCPKCLQSVDEDDQQHIDDEKQKIQDEIDVTKTKADKYGEAIAHIKVRLAIVKKSSSTTKEDLNTKKIRIVRDTNITKNITQLENWNTQINDDIEVLKDSKVDFEAQIKEIKEGLDEVTTVIAEIKNQLDVLDIVKFVVSEEGVKSYIVKKILQIFNSKLTYYLKKMDANCICIFNEYFEEEIVNEKGKHCSYFNFSGAERKNIDLACLFAFISIRRLQGVVSYNILMFDELLDTSLDEKGVQLALDIIKEEVSAHELSTFLITHRKEAAGIGDTVIQLVKENDITTLVK
tara:strand:+ start:635 stop:2425 length:1791 start_codon:yes stop_codon:yes gene_type:complete